MLQLSSIKKTYKTGDFVQTALDGVSIAFRENEFVAILGASGSGKTTLLNIIGGLDQYDAGELEIEGRSTRKFREDRKSTRLNSSHVAISYAVFCLKTKQAISKTITCI